MVEQNLVYLSKWQQVYYLHLHAITLGKGKIPFLLSPVMGKIAELPWVATSLGELNSEC